MAVLSFQRRPRWRNTNAILVPLPLNSGQQARVRSLIDLLQVLIWKKPKVAAWLIDWLEFFLQQQLK